MNKPQYIKDRYIRFKQIELDDAELFDLFIDVPIIPLRPAGRAGAELHREYSMAVERSARQQAWRYREAGRPSAIVGVATNPRSGFEEDTDEDELVDAPFHRGYVSIGAARLLVEPEFRPPGAGIIIEGAPGQGKSTLSQFLVQIQRARLLDDRSVMSKFPPHHLDSPAQIPFKLELRDLAVWMRGLDPWDNDQERAHGRAKSLEGALAAHVERFSGGVEFSVTDLRNVIRGRPTLVVLDALDEVADLQDRAMVIEEVTSAIGRLASAEQNSSAEQNLRVLITSRPTAISNAPTFSHSKFCYLRLDSISPSEALHYTSLWAKARRLQAKAELDLRRILGQRLNTPHMADLARNTMQLSILLSLIHVRGASLPDKRTELYDEYINLFLNREAEKSLIVRDRRELIVAIYQYLGYYLHARAESGRSNGRIAEAELRRVVRDYLEDQGESTELVDDLFTGLAERVFALVSRMQGTYEFEVQPIREYFAARYLYNTAPYSPTGRETGGTKPDRFEGISQNPYWLNVTRFFAGCFSKGELCDLAERVCELIRNPAFELAAYPRVMAISLLQDWVFSQSRRATDEVAAAVSDDHGLRWIGNSLLLPFWRSYSYDAVLPPSTGGQRLAQAAWKKLVSVTQIECIDDLARVIVFHTTPQERHALLESVLRREANVAIPSLGLALMFEILDDIEPETVSRELAQIPESKRGSVLVDCVRARVNFASFNEADVAAATQAILGARPHVHNYHGEPGPLTEMGVFWGLTNPSFWLQGSYRSSYLLQRLESRKNREISTTEAFARVFEWNRYALSLAGGDFHTGLDLWRMLIDRLESDFGESWSSIDLAAASAGIRSSQERGAGAASLFDPGANMADRFRFARRRGSQLEWWRQQLSAISDFRDARAYALAVNVWATPDVQQVLLEDVDGILRELDEVDQLNVVSATRFAGRTYSTIARRKWLKGDWVSQLDELSSSTKALLL